MANKIEFPVRIKCDACYNGRVPHNNPDAIYESTYCKKCHGFGYIDSWISEEELALKINKILSLQEQQK